MRPGQAGIAAGRPRPLRVPDDNLADDGAVPAARGDDGTYLPLEWPLRLSAGRSYRLRVPDPAHLPRQQLVRFAGRTGLTEALRFTMTIPHRRDPDEPEASPLQVAAVMRSLDLKVPDCTARQANQLLSARDFVRYVIGRGEFERFGTHAQEALVRLAVAFVCAQPAMRTEIARRSRNPDRFEPQPPWYRPVKHTIAVHRFALDVVVDMRAAGALGFG